jgi:hypothetical protein
LLFYPLPAPSDEDIARLAHAVCRKVGRILNRHKASEEGQASLLDRLANASVQGLVATGPRRGCRVLRLGAGSEAAEAAVMGKCCAEFAGFNIHANVRVRANDREGLEHLCEYLARPPIANDRLVELPDGRLALKFKHVWDVLVCPECAGRMKIIAVVTASASVRRILAHLDLPTQAPRLRPARPPPQTELGDGQQDGGAFYPDSPCPDW